MIDVLTLARVMLSRDALRLRALALEATRHPSDLAQAREPNTTDPYELAAAASVLELLCERAGVTPPRWTHEVPPAPQPRHLVAASETMPRMRELCEQHAPEALRRRGFFAPPDFLSFA